MIYNLIRVCTGEFWDNILNPHFRESCDIFNTAFDRRDMLEISFTNIFLFFLKAVKLVGGGIKKLFV